MGAIWNATIKLKDLIEQYGNEKAAGGDELTLVPKYAELMAKRMEEQKGILFRQFPALAKKLRAARTESESHVAMDALYDYCDMMRIWVD